MRGDPAHLPRVMLLQLAVGVAVAGSYRVDLGEDAHGYVVEEAGDEGGGFDEPFCPKKNLSVIILFCTCTYVWERKKIHSVGMERKGGRRLTKH